MSLVLRLPREIHLCRRSSNVPRLPSLCKLLQTPQVWLTSVKEHNPLRLPHGTTPNVQNRSEHVVITIFTSTCASCHSRVRFLKSPISKTPNMRCFGHVGFEICLAPQRRALFQHLSFEKCSESAVFSCTFGLQNVFRARTPCTF